MLEKKLIRLCGIFSTGTWVRQRFNKANKERVKVTKCGAEKICPPPSQQTALQTARLLLFHDKCFLATERQKSVQKTR